ncbi:MAG: ABC transporter ATP-binding protein [Deltaproteobacteria bacterium]|nr:ABC transporter ATP-binding protein [Deltaproteobacteria bacterium]
MSLLQIKNLSVQFDTPQGILKAVDDVSFELDKGETLGLVGESGCGKTVTSLSILRLIPSPPGRITQGSILFDGKDLLKLPEKEMRKIRGSEIAMIFQEPMTALNPVFTIGNQIMETIRTHRKVTQAQARDQAEELLKVVGIPEPKRRLKSYPHELSGGMRQRAMIAIALSCNPKILIADEPTTALDVTIQAQILELLQKLQEEFHMSILLITHDLGIVAERVRDVAIMYAGKIVEQTSTKRLFENPLHPYTRGLLGSIPQFDPARSQKRLKNIPGVVPDLRMPPPGCLFSDRCFMKVSHCEQEIPPLEEKEAGHGVRCFEV